MKTNAAAYLEGAPQASFTGFTLSILEGGDGNYRRRLFAVIDRARAAAWTFASYGSPR